MGETNTITNLVIGIFAGVFAGILLPWLSMFLRYVFGRVLVFRRITNLTGVYDCEYHIPWKPKGDNIIYERIFIFRTGKKYYGFLINNTDDERYRNLPKPGLRLQGELFVERYFIGWWSHPLPDDNTYGAFNLRIDLGGKLHEGQWNGESSTYNRILEGRWVWKKNTQAKYGIMKLMWHLMLGNK